VLTGRVVEHGSELNVETELVNVATGAQLWGERYTRSINDASLLQAAITRGLTALDLPLPILHNFVPSKGRCHAQSDWRRSAYHSTHGLY
jgi:hypothetical protein